MRLDDVLIQITLQKKILVDNHKGNYKKRFH